MSSRVGGEGSRSDSSETPRLRSGRRLLLTSPLPAAAEAGQLVIQCLDRRRGVLPPQDGTRGVPELRAHLVVFGAGGRRWTRHGVDEGLVQVAEERHRGEYFLV